MGITRQYRSSFELKQLPLTHWNWSLLNSPESILSQIKNPEKSPRSQEHRSGESGCTEISPYLPPLP